MNLTILPQQVLLNGHDLLNIRESERFLACFGQPSRQREIPMHPSGTRVAMVWDELGLVAYEDRPEGLMSHLYLAFNPLNTPEHPSKASQCVIQINGGIVTSETSERTLPQSGHTPISVDHGKHFFYETGLYCVAFLFGRSANPHDGEIAVGSLECFSFSWRSA